MKQVNLIICLVFLTNLTMGQNNYTSTRNYVVETIYLAPTSSSSSVKSVSKVTYLDGFGRKLQEIQVGGAPGGTGDIIQRYMYGVLGRVERKYLPYNKNDNNGAFDSNVATSSNWNIYGTVEAPHAFTLTEYDNSSLDRVVKQTGPGKNWHVNQKGITTSYGMNKDNEVKLYRVPEDGALVSTGYYVAGALQKVTVTDEDGKQVETYTDNMDQTVLVVNVEDDNNRLETYSVYDDRGRLRYVLSPEASARVGTTSTRTTEAIRLFGYYYEYDRYNRLILKQLPGCDPVYMVYDKRDRLVMSQDGKQRAENTNKWSYSLYDNQNRVIETGEVLITGTDKTHAALQGAAFDSDNYIPTGNRSPLQYTLYDNYTATNNVPVLSFQPVTGYASSYHTHVTGLVTSVKTKVLDSSSEKWLTTTTYYDNRCRVIQTVSDNVEGYTSRVDMKYDFVGNVVQQRESHQVNTSKTDVLESVNLYDDRGRLLSSAISLNGGSPAIVRYIYDAVGRLVSKKLGNTTETITYNPRGWLMSKESTKFKMKLRYEVPSGGSIACWNGNISEWEWQQGASASMMYGFTYDGVNRLRETMQKQKSSTTWSTLLSSYLEKGLTYDRNGNIKTLQRTANGATVDNLVYSYTGNQLTSLTENVSSSLTGDIYSRGNAASGSYTYDKNGNMIIDSRRALNFSYNVLNLLSEIKTTSNVLKAKYCYLADGTKLRVRDNGEINGFDYLGSLTYRKNSAGLQLESAGFGDGVIRQGDSNSGQQEVNYFLADHLGSVRVIVDSSGNVLERNDYYPFGARHARGDYPQLADNRYKYNGKEEQVTGDLELLDYGARMYDKTLIRWFINDPLGEKYFDISGYAYCLNNPVNAIDPDGKIVIFINGNHYGDGGSSEYWRKYITLASYLGGGFYGSISRMEWFAFDKAAMKQLNDYNAIYRDGALGGFAPINMRGNLINQKRIDAGYKQGESDVASIIANLKRDENGKIKETIKIITHSMGGAYGQGYAKAILDYIDMMGIEDVQIDFIAHFAPYHPEKLEAQKHSKLGDIFQFSHEFDGLAGNEKIKGATFMETSNNKKKGHGIIHFLEYIQDLPQGKYIIVNGQLVPQK